MNTFHLFRKLWPFIRKYRSNVALALILTLVCGLLGLVTPLAMEYTLNAVHELMRLPIAGREVWRNVGILAAIMLGNELLGLLLQLWQKYLGDSLRFRLAGDLYNYTIQRIVSYHLAFFALSQNQTGKLEKRIDKGIESISKTIKNVFVEILPMLVSSALALFLMYKRNVWVGAVATLVMPLFVLISRAQTKRQGSIRRGIQGVREEKTQALFGLLESIFVVKSLASIAAGPTMRLGFLNDSVVAYSTATASRSMTP